MKGFPGFPPGESELVLLPQAFFEQLAPLIDDLAELKVTLHCYWRLSQAKGALRFLRQRDLLRDDVLLSGLAGEVGRDAAEILIEALERAVARGSLLHVRLEKGTEREERYFANTPKGRAAVQKIKRGEDLQGLAEGAQVQVTRPNIFVLYEQNIGLLQPLIADELREAERTYPSQWIEEAFRLAAKANVRRWRYVRTILERWATEGRSDGTTQRDSKEDYRRYIENEYADYIEH